MRKFLGFVCLVVLLASASYGATVTGTVKGPDGTPFEGAFVQAQNTKTKIMVSVLSDKGGRYRIENLGAGDYQLQIRAVGYKVDPKSGVSLTANQSASFDWALQKGMVHWNDLSFYQGKQLFPDGKGKNLLVGTCFACHGFESRMASITRDEDGWKDRVQYMRDAMHAFLYNFTDENAADVTSYMNSLFGQDSILSKSPADMPAYKNVARPPFSDEAMKIVYVEYTLPGPNRMPWSAAPDKNGIVWMPYYGRANMIGKLDPKTGEVQEFRVPNEGTALIHSVLAAPDGSAWLTEQGANKIGRWDPNTKQITEYQDSYIAGKELTLPGGSKHTLRIDARGGIWASGGPASHFDPETKKFTHFAEITAPYGVALDNEGNAWYSSGGGGDAYIAKVDGKTMKVTKYAPPTEKSYPRRIVVAPDDIVWFAEFRAGKIGRFDPKTSTFKEFQLPGADPSPYALEIDKNHNVWYSSEQMDVIGRLDPATGQVIEYPFNHSENTMREFFYDPQGRMWWGSPANNKVGYFYLTGGNERASN